MAEDGAVGVPTPLTVAPAGGEPLTLPDAEGGAEGVPLTEALREPPPPPPPPPPPEVPVAGAVGSGEALAASGEGVALLVPPSRGEAEGTGESDADAALLALGAPLKDAGATDGVAPAEGEAAPPPEALNGALGEDSAEGESPAPPLAVGAPEALPPPLAGEALLVGLPLRDRPGDGVAAASGESEGAPLAEAAPSGEAVAGGLRLPASAEGVNGAEGDA